MKDKEIIDCIIEEARHISVPFNRVNDYFALRDVSCGIFKLSPRGRRYSDKRIDRLKDECLKKIKEAFR